MSGRFAIQLVGRRPWPPGLTRALPRAAATPIRLVITPQSGAQAAVAERADSVQTIIYSTDPSIVEAAILITAGANAYEPVAYSTIDDVEQGFRRSSPATVSRSRDVRPGEATWELHSEFTDHRDPITQQAPTSPTTATFLPPCKLLVQAKSGSHPSLQPPCADLSARRKTRHSTPSPRLPAPRPPDSHGIPHVKRPTSPTPSTFSLQSASASREPHDVSGRWRGNAGRAACRGPITHRPLVVEFRTSSLGELSYAFGR